MKALQYNLFEHSYMLAALLIMASTFIVALFYCLDALHGERRDRSILFWKSLPVSDLVTVLSKASIPIFILPLITFVITLALWIMMWLLSSAVLLGSGLKMPAESLHFSLVGMSLLLLYHLIGIHGLWYAPIYGWLILVSGWARRAAILWATVPLIAIGIVEKVAFGSSHFANLLRYRFGGGGESMGSRATGLAAFLMPSMSVGQFLTSPGLWTGLAVTALFLILAMRVRRSRWTDLVRSCDSRHRYERGSEMHSTILFFHIVAGTLGMLSGFVAVFLRKGSRRHRRAGIVFVIAMLSLSASGTYLAILKHQPGNVLGGMLTFYLVATAWITARRKQEETGNF